MNDLLNQAKPIGESIYLDDFERFIAEGIATRGDYSDLALTKNKWLLVENICGARNRRVLCASAESQVPNLMFEPGRHGRFAIHIGYHTHGPDEIGVYVRLDDEPHFANFISERYEPTFMDVVFKVAELTESSRIEIGAMGSNVFLNYVKLVPVQSVEPPAPTRRLIGICDTPVNLLQQRPTGSEAASMVRLHKDAGFDLVLWKVFKVLCEYDTKVGVRRDMGVPYDTLRQAVEEAKKIGIDFYGWVRINNEQNKYKGSGGTDGSGLFGPTTPFHLAHPEKRMLRKDGTMTPRLSFAYPEVRRHKIDIICEVAAYGVNGICIDVLRQPPMAEYDLPLVEEFKRRTGQDPREMPGHGTEEWLRFRCEAFTQFLRETRAAIDKQSGRRLPLMVRTFDQPWRNLQAGCDVEKWLDEQIMDSILFAPHLPTASNSPTRLDLRDYIQLAQGRVPVFGQVWRYGSFHDAEILSRDLYDQGVQGVAIYESEAAVQRPTIWENLWRFRRPECLRGLRL